jgi:hypothetical protein
MHTVAQSRSPQKCESAVQNLEGPVCAWPLVIALVPRAGATANLPAGSYQTTCNNASADGTTLTATCATGTGVWKTTQLIYSNCQSEIWNGCGHLVCNNGEPVG